MLEVRFLVFNEVCALQLWEADIWRAVKGEGERAWDHSRPLSLLLLFTMSHWLYYVRKSCGTDRHRHRTGGAWW